MKNKIDTVLVTGGAGFIGSHVAKHIVKMGHKVVVLDDLSGGYKDNIPQGAKFREGSVLDKRLLDDLFKKNRFDRVFHLAAYAAEGLSHFARSFNYVNNVVGSAEIISRCIRFKCRRFVFTSSIAVYGAGQVPMLESMVPRPEDPYGIAKFAVERDIEAAQRLFGLDYVIFRPHNVYGENQNIGDPFRNVVGIFMRQILNGERLTIFGDGKQTRSFSYIDDVAPIIARSGWASKARNEIFNIGGDIPCTVNELAHQVAAAMGTTQKIMYLPLRMEVKDAYSDHEKAKKAFRISKTFVSLQEGLSRMAVWVKETGARQSRKLPAVEVWEKLPPSWKQALLLAGQKVVI